jgi:hypothetical protein
MDLGQILKEFVCYLVINVANFETRRLNLCVHASNEYIKWLANDTFACDDDSMKAHRLSVSLSRSKHVLSLLKKNILTKLQLLKILFRK